LRYEVRYSGTKGFSPRKAVLLLSLFFLIIFNGFGQTEPTFNWLNDVSLGSGGLGNEGGIVISVDTDSEGNVYVLTFGSGVYKYDPYTEEYEVVIPDIYGESDDLNAPLDLAIDNNDIIHIADSGSKSIKRFTTDGTELEKIGGFFGSDENEFFEPRGLEFDSDNNLYIVDAFIGDGEPRAPNVLRIYYANGDYRGFEGTEEHPLNNPYRVAATDDYILISNAENNGEVLVFNKDLTYHSTLGNIGSPGSLFVDKSGFIYAVDYADQLDFTDIFELLNGNFLIALSLRPQIIDGIEAGDFKIQVYNSDLSHSSTITDFPANSNEDHIQFPLDVTLDATCGKLFLNDATISGLATLNSNLEIYQRTPSYDQEKPQIDCPTEITVTADTGKNFVIVNYDEATAIDNCDNDVEIEKTEGLDSGSEFPIGDSEIEFTATDDSGNISTCTFTITVKASDDEENTPPVITCPENVILENEEGECGATINYQLPQVSDAEDDDLEPELISGPASGDFVEVGTYTVTFRVTDSEDESAQCSFTVTVEDTENPVITTCHEPVTATYDPEEGYEIPDFTNQLVARDNCTAFEDLIITQNPQEGEIINSSQVIILTVEDTNGNIATCDFQLTLQEEQEPTFTCPDPAQRTLIELDENCDFEIPDYRDRITNFQGFENEPVLVQSSVRTGNILNISISVSDGTEEIGECNFPVNLEDQTPPDIICPPTINVPYTNTKEYVVEDYYSELQISDNCSTTFEHTQSPMPGTVINEDATIEFTIIDENGNESGCNFRIEFFRDTELQILNCPGDQVIEVDANCSYPTPDIASLIETNIEGAEISQSITPGFQINGSILLTITAKFEDQTDTCEVQLIADDTVDPVISCPADQIVSPDENGEFMLPNYILQADYDDNCFIAQTEQFPETGTIINSNTEIEIKVTDGSGNQTSCFFSVEFEDSPEKPFECKGSISFNLDEDGTVTIEPEDLLNISGDVSEFEKYEFSLSRTTFGCDDVTGQIPVTVNYTGPVNGSCTVKVDINELVGPSIDCPQETINVVYESGTEYSLPDYSSVFEISDNCTPSSELSFEQSPEPGTVYTQEGEVPIEFKVIDNNGNETTCSFSVNLTHGDEAQPQPPIAVDDTYATAVNTTLNVTAPGVLGNDSDPDSRGITAVLVQNVTNGSLTLNANGSFTYIPNEDFLGPDGFTYVANDGELNSEITFVTIIVSGTSELRLNCPQSESVIKANGNCEYIVPDFATRVEFSPLNATIEQSIPAGSLVEEEVDITITASFEGETESCTFQLLLRDNTPPVIDCPGDRTVFIAEGGTYVIPDFRNEIERSDNCGLGQVIQEPEPNTVINSDTQVNFVIFDAVSNASTCSFIIDLEVDPPGNQAPIASLDTYSTLINTTLDISAPDGVLSNDIDSDSDELTAILVNDVNNGILTLNADGSFVYVPDNDFTGTDQFSYFANDGEFNSEQTFVSIEVLEAAILNIQCKESFVLELDANGVAILNAEDLYTGDDTGVSFSLSRNSFNCEDIGKNEVLLTYSGAASGSCNILINVVDFIPPNLETRDISINLDVSGMASISAEDIVVGFSDNCDPAPVFELSRSSFSCKDVGTNEVQVTAEDSSGNMITETIIVTITDEDGVCDGSLEGSEYIFIYPNPNTGSFKVATPLDVTIQRMEVFDHRGRFIAAKDYDADTVEYAIDLGPLQEAVYVVKLLTSEGTEVRRFIFKY